MLACKRIPVMPDLRQTPENPERSQMLDWRPIFDAAADYDAFLAKHATDEQRRRWDSTLEGVTLKGEQRELLGGFTRTMNVLCLAGAWCGDCAKQCPILQRFAVSTPRIALRLLDRDADAAVANELRICGGGRVPVVVFLSEEFAECGRYGDRTLSTYRKMAAEQIGAACPTGLIAGDENGADVIADWLREFERIQLMLRLSPRLRKLHAD